MNAPRNQPSAQSNERAGAVAEFLLAAASSLNVKVGTDGVDVITVTRSRVPFELIRQLHAEQNRQAIIDHIRRENAGGQS